MLNYIKPLLTLSFWFKMRPEPFLAAFNYFFIILFGLFIAAGIAAGRIYAQKKDKFVLRHSAKAIKNWFWAGGFLGYLWMFFNYERAVFLGARFWFLIWFASFGIWLGFIIRRIKKIPVKAEALRKQADFEKYLPKRSR